MMFRCAKYCRAAAVFTLLSVQWASGGETPITVVPVGTGPNGELAAGAFIDGDTITLNTDPVDPVPVFLEFRIGDWDPDDIGVRLKGYQIKFESSSLTTGAAGELLVNVGTEPCGACSDNATPCFGIEDCTLGSCSVSGNPCHTVAADCPSGELCVGAAICEQLDNGTDICQAQLGAGSLCSPDGYFLGTGTCSFGFVDMSHPNFVLANAVSVLPAIDVSVPDVRLGALVVSGPPNDPTSFPAEGLYAATLALLVPPDAQGTFTISVAPFPATVLQDGELVSITPLTVHSAKIRVNPGRCCFNLQLTPLGGQRCIDDVTASECATQRGVTFFEAGETCATACPAVCGDNINNQASEECDGTSANFCPGECSATCVCVSCGDGVLNGSEICDGADDDACPGLCLGDCTCPAFCGDDVVNQPGEDCDGADDSACPGLCLGDCTCPATCGDGIVNQPAEECDGLDDVACPGLCLGDCTCDAFCGDDELNPPGEECDGIADAACPGLCLGNCTCAPFCGDDVVNLKSEECDGSDDAACAGICLGDCTCNPTCGDVDGDGNADMLGVAILMNCFTGSGGGPVAPECECAKYDTDDDIDLDDFLGFLSTLNGP